MSKKTPTYEDAMKRLEEIVKGLESGMQPLESLSEKLKEAQELAAFCQKKLTATEADVEAIFNAK